MKEFSLINKELKKYLKKVYSNSKINLEEYETLLRRVYEYVNTIHNSGIYYDEYFKDNTTPKTPNKKFKKEEIICYVVAFLYEIDSSFVVQFEEALEQKIIHFTEEKELEGKEIKENNFYYFINCSGNIDGNDFINIVLTHTITDAFILVHEFMHYVNVKGIELKEPTYYFFTEGYSHFFETLFLDFCMKREELKEEAICYFEGFLYSLLVRTYQFVTEYIVLDVFLCKGKISYSKIYKYCSSFENRESLFDSIVVMVKEVEKSFEEEKRNYLEDTPYVLGIPLSEKLLEEWNKNKENVLKDYQNLNRLPYTYFFNTYYLQEKEVYDKVFCLRRR